MPIHSHWRTRNVLMSVAGLLAVFLLLALQRIPSSTAQTVTSGSPGAVPQALVITCPDSAISCTVWLADPRDATRGEAVAKLALASITGAALSPDQMTLAVSGEIQGGEELWLVPMSGQPARLADQALHFTGLAWNRQGDLAYLRTDSQDATVESPKTGETNVQALLRQQIVTLNATSETKQVVAEASADQPLDLLGWASDPSVLIYAKESSDPRGTGYHLQQTAVSAASHAPFTQALWPDSFPSRGLLSPDGSRVMLGDAQGVIWRSVASSSSGQVAKPQPHFYAIWDSTGENVVYVSTSADGVTRLALQPASGGEPRQLGRLDPGGDWRLLALSRGGDWLAAMHYYTGTYFINISLQKPYLLPEIQGQTLFAGWVEGGGTFTAQLLPAAATPTPTPSVRPTPTCPPVTCSQPRIYGYQPPLRDLRQVFIQAGNNQLGSSSPAYATVCTGVPCSPARLTVSAAQPIPQILLRGIARQESFWFQFEDASTGGFVANQYACTNVSPDCGYGLMQITDCMNSGGCTPAWDKARVAGDWVYNLGTGTSMLIGKWNGVLQYINPNDPTDPADWYYAVAAYNGLASINDPNNSIYDPRRPPYAEGLYKEYGYTYQERVYGWIAHPEKAFSGYSAGYWRAERIPQVPRGLVKLRVDSASDYFPRPVTTLLYNLSIASGNGPSLVLRNPTNINQAVDIVLYNNDHTFNRRWLDGSTNPPWFVQNVVLPPGTARTLPLSAAFLPTETFNGYVELTASEGLETALQAAVLAPQPMASLPPSTAVRLPLIFHNSGECHYWLNGGFEVFQNGRPANWNVSSSDGYALAGSTWFLNGHSGAYLGGYDNSADTLSQGFIFPDKATLAHISFAWYVQSSEPLGNPVGDQLNVMLRDTQGKPLITLSTLTNQSPRGIWGATAKNFPSYPGKTVFLSFESLTNQSNPTSFFIDDVDLSVCP